MTVLTKRTEWRIDRPANETRRSTDLTPAEQENVRRALRFLAKRHGDTSKLAKQMRAHRETVQRPARGGVVSAGIALRAARLAGVAVEELLAGPLARRASLPALWPKIDHATPNFSTSLRRHGSNGRFYPPAHGFPVVHR